MCPLRKTPQGVKYYEMRPGSLPATEKSPGRPRISSEDKSDTKIFSVPGSERCLVKTPRTTWAFSIQRQMICFRDQKIVKARSSIPQTTKSGFAVNLLADYARNDEREVKASRHRTASHKPLRAISVTVPSNHFRETRHIKSITGDRRSHSFSVISLEMRLLVVQL